MIGIHFQRTIPNWDKAIQTFPKGTLHKVVGDQFMCRNLHRLGYPSVFRHLSQEEQKPASTLEENKVKARKFFSEFIDGTFWQEELWRYMDFIEEWNEHIIKFPDHNEEARFLLWVQAVGEVWRDDYQLRYPDKLGNTPLVFLNVPVGNDFRIEFARLVARFNGVASYHGYTHVLNGMIDPYDWEFHSGRWVELDRQFVREGIKLRWISTEAGPYRGVYDGWKHPTVYNGNFAGYLNSVRYTMEKVTEWNALNNNRFLGYQLFTVGRTGEWDYYELDESNIRQIGEVVSSYKPTPPPTPEPPPPVATVQPRVPYGRHMLVVPQDATLEQWLDICRDAYANRRTVGFSYDDAGYGAPSDKVTIKPLASTTAVLYGIPAARHAEFRAWYATHYPGTVVQFVDASDEIEAGALGVDISQWQARQV